MEEGKQVQVKVSGNDSTGLIVLAVVLWVFLFGGEPDIAESLRVLLAKMAGLKP